MPWKEMVIDNSSIPGQNKDRKYKSFIERYESKSITFQLTARYHISGHKWYLDCPQVGLYEELLGEVSSKKREWIRHIALLRIQQNLDRQDQKPFEELSKAMKSCNKAA